MDLQYVVGLDIGHGFSGYAFSSRSSSDIYLNENWSSQYTAYKTPTALLMRREGEDGIGEVVAFGYDAYKEHSQILTDPDKGKHLFLYHHFKDFCGPETEKRRLNCENCTMYDATLCFLKDEAEFFMIYTNIVKYLKQHACRRIEEMANKRVTDSEVLWVLTLSPWEPAAGISAALDKAGLDGIRVQRKLGSVTNSALCHCLKVDKFPHSCCVVINLGANASHLVLYQNTDTSGILPWREVTSCYCSGSDRIKHRLIHAVAECCGWDFISSYTHKYPALWLELLNNLEHGFTTVTERSHLVCELTSAFGGEFAEQTSTSSDLDTMSLRKAFQKTFEQDGVVKKSGISVSKNGKLIITKDRLHNICKPIFQELKEAWIHLYMHGQKMDTEPEVVYLVGGLAANELVKERMRAIIGDVRLVILEQPEVCVMKGAAVVGRKFLN